MLDEPSPTGLEGMGTGTVRHPNTDHASPSSSPALRVLVVTKIFPNLLTPSESPYNRQQLAALNRHARVEVLALVPWFPGVRLTGKRSAAGRFADLPARWEVDGLPVRHPRVLYLPLVGSDLSGALYTASLLPEALRRRGRVDVVMGAFAYPDGWAAVALARVLGVPAVVKVHGSDINVFGQGRLARHLRWAFERAHAVVAPSRQLIERAVALGANPSTSRAIANGVDLKLFRPRDRYLARDALGRARDERIILFVGRLEPRKGVDELFNAVERLVPSHPTLHLVLIGDGVRADAYRARARAHKLPVTFLGTQPSAQVAEWLAAADLLALPSWAEGTPNVVLESLASGRPVVATDVGGIPDVIHDARLGRLVAPRAPEALARALEATLATEHDALAIAKTADLGDWARSGESLYEVIAEAAATHRA